MPGVLVDIRPLRETPAFRRLWLGTTASAFGGQMNTLAVIFFVWDRTGNPAAVGLIGLVTAIPLVTVALVGGAFSDHVDRRRLALVTTSGQAVTSLLMAVAATGGALWAMLVLAGLGSGLSALSAPARRTFIPRLLPPDRLAAGLALNHVSFQAAMLLGPTTAGVLIGWSGVGVCFVVDAVTFVAALVGIAGLPGGGASHDAGRPGPAAIWSGIRFAAVTPGVRGALLADLAATILAMPVALFPVINAERFGGTPEMLGLLTASVAVGGVLASALSGVVTRRRHPGVVLLWCGAAWGASLSAVGLSNQLWVTIALLSAAGAADTWAVVSRGTVVQALTPDSHRARVAALEHIVGVAGPQLGSVRAGLVAAATSGGTAIITGGVSCLVAIGLIASLTPQLRRFRPG